MPGPVNNGHENGVAIIGTATITEVHCILIISLQNQRLLKAMLVWTSPSTSQNLVMNSSKKFWTYHEVVRFLQDTTVFKYKHWKVLIHVIQFWNSKIIDTNFAFSEQITTKEAR